MILFTIAALSLLAASSTAVNIAPNNNNGLNRGNNNNNNNNNLNVVPVTNPQMTIQELLASQGFGSGQQVAILVIAPQNLASVQGLLGGQQQQQFFGRGYGQQQTLASNQQQLLVEAPAQPVSVHYKSQSIPLNVQHTHIPAPTPEVKLSTSQEEPHKIIHEIIRPVIQEVREIIQPYRRIVQEIRPVQESIVSQVSTNKQAKPSSVNFQKLAAENQQQ